MEDSPSSLAPGVTERILERRNSNLPSTISFQHDGTPSDSGPGPAVDGTRAGSDHSLEHLVRKPENSSAPPSPSTIHLKWTDVTETTAANSTPSSSIVQYDTYDDDEEDVLQRVETILGAGRNEAFVRRLSELSMVRTSSTTSIIKRYPLTDDDSASLPQNELISTLECMRDNLKKTEKKLMEERDRRKSRDKSLLKLARELRKAKDNLEENDEDIGNHKRELQTVRAELILVQKKLDHQKALMRQQRSEHKTEYDRALNKAKDVYNSTIAEHDKRIREISKSHARQCEDLCREIIQANQEASRLRSKMSDSRLGKQPPYQRKRLALILSALVVCAVTLMARMPIIFVDDAPPQSMSNTTASYQLQIRNPVVLLVTPKARPTNATFVPSGIPYRPPVFRPLTKLVAMPVPSPPMLIAQSEMTPSVADDGKTQGAAPSIINEANILRTRKHKKIRRIGAGIRKWFGKRVRAIRKVIGPKREN